MNVNANIAVQHVIQIKNGIRKHVNVNIIVKAKKILAGVLARVLVRTVGISKVLLMNQELCGIKLYAMDILPTNTSLTNVTSTVPINCYIKKIQ